MLENTSRRGVLSAMSAALLLKTSTGAFAQAWPGRTIRVIVPYPPGGASDVITRVIAKHLTAALGTTVIVENRPGASTMVGAEAAARAEPDGSTLFVASTTTMCVVPTIFGPRTLFDPRRDFTPIGLVSRAPFFMMVAAASNIRSMKDLVEAARQKPGQISYGSNGRGGASHLGMLLLQRAAGIELLHVPYRSITTAATDLIGGRVMTVLGDLSTVNGLVQAGQIRLLASASPERSALAPDVPTFKESAEIDIGDVGPWFGFFGPAKLPRNIVDRLNSELRTFLTTKEAEETYKTIAQLPLSSTPEELSRLIEADTQRFATIIREQNITLD